MGAGSGKSRRVSTSATSATAERSQQLEVLSPVQKQILVAIDAVISERGHVAYGCSAAEIAKQMGGATRGVAQHLSRMSRLYVIRGHVPVGATEMRWRIRLDVPANNVPHRFRGAAEDVAARQHGNGGGWVAMSTKVHHDAYVGPHAEVSEKATVDRNAVIAGTAQVSESASVLDCAVVDGAAKVTGNSRVSREARVSDGALVAGSTRISGNAVIGGEAKIIGEAQVDDCARVAGSATVRQQGYVSGTAVVDARASVCRNAQVIGQAKVSGEAVVDDDVVIDGQTVVRGRARVIGTQYLRGGVFDGDQVVGGGVRPFAGVGGENMLVDPQPVTF